MLERRPISPSTQCRRLLVFYKAGRTLPSMIPPSPWSMSIWNISNLLWIFSRYHQKVSSPPPQPQIVWSPLFQGRKSNNNVLILAIFSPTKPFSHELLTSVNAYPWRQRKRALKVEITSLLMDIHSQFNVVAIQDLWQGWNNLLSKVEKSRKVKVDYFRKIPFFVSCSIVSYGYSNSASSPCLTPSPPYEQLFQCCFWREKSSKANIPPLFWYRHSFFAASLSNNKAFACGCTNMRGFVGWDL